MIPGSDDLTVQKGEEYTYALVIRAGSPLSPVNLTGYRAQFLVRVSRGGQPIIDLSDDDDEIQLGGNTGRMEVLLDEDTTASLPAGVYEFRLRLASGDAPFKTYVKGSFTVVNP